MLGLPIHPITNLPIPIANYAIILQHPMTLRRPLLLGSRGGRWLLILLLTMLGAVVLTPYTAYADAPSFQNAISFGPGESIQKSVAVGDFNGDGFLDIVQGNYGTPSYVYLNDGHGGFNTTSQAFGGVQNTWSVAVGDFNGDGFLDIVQGNDGTPSYVYLNDGHGGFNTLGKTLGRVENTHSVAVGDFNGDGFLDIVQGNDGTPSYVYLNDGRGGFNTLGQVLGGVENTYSVAVGDFNGDGFLDIAQGNRMKELNSDGSPNTVPGNDGISYIYLNDGHSGFYTPGQAFGRVQEGTPSMAVGDFDDDGFLDIVQGNGRTSYVYLNDRRGGFQTTSKALKKQENTGLTVGDFNGDGFLDIAQGNLGTPYIYLNDEHGNFLMPDYALWVAPHASSIVAGDFNGDGFLDIVLGNIRGPNYVYLNDGRGGFPMPSQAFGHEQGLGPTSVAIGDFDGDGFLDIAQGKHWQQSYVYQNDRYGGFYTLGHALGGVQNTTSIAVGDFNGDGFLDIVQGNMAEDFNGLVSKDAINGGISYVYLNDGRGGFHIPGQALGSGEHTNSVAVGDFNGDGFLDIVQGNRGISYVYLNDGHGGFNTLGQALGGPQMTSSVAVGDFNGDGFLDIVQGNSLAELNSSEVGLDIIPESNGISYVYLNDGHGNFNTPGQALAGVQNTNSIAVGDFNGDGFLDIVQGNDGTSYVYLNDGHAGFHTPSQALAGVQDTNSMAVGDFNGDGFLDIVQGNYGTSYVYLNDRYGGFRTPSQALGRVENTNSVAVGDLNGDGFLDIVQGNYETSYIYLNGLSNDGSRITVTRPVHTGEANFFSAPMIIDSHTIPITYTLSGAEGGRVGHVAGFYSPDGGGRWLPAVATSTTVTTNLTTAGVGVTHIYTWNTFASGFFGQSDNVVVRLVAYSQPLTTTQPITGSYRYTNSVPGATQRATASAMTFPFRVRGTQVRVVDQEHNPLAGALVYRLPVGQFSGATPMADAAGQPFRTDLQGYLSGRGALQLGDRLAALLPMTPTHPLTFTQQYSYFLTSAPPNTNGLALTELSSAGVVTLTVPISPTTNTHSLMLFNLTVSLEWDASADDLFQAELENGFKRASEILFKVTNGQAAIGRVDVLPAKHFWNRADLILYASNSLRPSAAIGGVVKAPMGEMVFGNPDRKGAKKSVATAYVPGQIRMGTSWDPFGEEAGDLSEQWWRALAHELSHHLFFLPDDYVGFKLPEANSASEQSALKTTGSANQRFLGRVDCKYSFMTTTFDPSYTRFLDRRFWTGDCKQTIAEFSTGRDDWGTITHFYPMLKTPIDPAGAGMNTQDYGPPEGPNLLPLDVTNLVFWSLPKRRSTLPARYFQLRSGGVIVRLPTARVYLFQTQGNDDPTDDVLIALGSPTGGGDRIKVRGGQPQDRLCLFDFGASDGKTYTGCIGKLSAASVSIPIRPLEPSAGAARWAPTIDVRALTTRTLLVTVTQTLPPNTRLKMQVFPAHYPSAPGVAPVAGLTLTQGVYVGQVSLLYPASDVSVRVWVDDGTNLEAISQFNLQLPWKPDDPVLAGPNTAMLGGPNTAMLGGPNTAMLGGPNTAMLGGPNTAMLGGAGRPVVGSAPNYKFAAPALSADAQVSIYNQAGVFEPNGIQSLQILPSPPEVEDESWLVPVGQAYFVQPDPALEAKRAIAITYLQRDVPEGYEYTLTIYYLRQGDKTWQRLATQQFVENLLVADLQPSAGTYAVMSTVVLPVLNSGVYLFAYPLPDTRSVTSALASLVGQYAELYEVGPNGNFLAASSQLVFGHVYAIELKNDQIESNRPVFLYLAPPRRSPDGNALGKP